MRELEMVVWPKAWLASCFAKTGFSITPAPSSCVEEFVLQKQVCRSLALYSRMFVLADMIPDKCQLFAGESER